MCQKCTQGRTLAEARRNLRHALHFILETDRRLKVKRGRAISGIQDALRDLRAGGCLEDAFHRIQQRRKPRKSDV